MAEDILGVTKDGELDPTFEMVFEAWALDTHRDLESVGWNQWDSLMVLMGTWKNVAMILRPARA